ncbi:alpha/beta-hydrolase [Pleomassaria siparia CBS 279.74]|uniref:Alpha/beta-hydrolase n=1 Tax=Pleomassaria siparia CBS 279.74 TaxID=1314801 RepID=A0A6G1JYF8_9PLEO|nr:alpha/beta-hydrolase [Pleomassaria siparia CBS 279.74]
MATKPTFVLVPGSFSKPEFYDNIVELIRTKGYEIQVVAIVTVGKKPGMPPSMYDDAAVISEAVTKYADEGKDVVLLAHSYGGIPITESMKDVSKTNREKAGEKGGVVRLGYMTCLVPSVGMSAGALIASANAPATENFEGWLHIQSAEVAAAIVFNDLPLEDGVTLANKFSQHSGVSFDNELTYAGYNDVPVSYLFCENDKCVPVEVQQKGIENIEASSGNKVEVTKISTDHCPMVGKPDLVVDWIVGLSGK